MDTEIIYVQEEMNYIYSFHFLGQKLKELLFISVFQQMAVAARDGWLYTVVEIPMSLKA